MNPPKPSTTVLTSMLLLLGYFLAGQGYTSTTTVNTTPASEVGNSKIEVEVYSVCTQWGEGKVVPNPRFRMKYNKGSNGDYYSEKKGGTGADYYCYTTLDKGDDLPWKIYTRTQNIHDDSSIDFYVHFRGHDEEGCDGDLDYNTGLFCTNDDQKKEEEFHIIIDLKSGSTFNTPGIWHTKDNNGNLLEKQVGSGNEYYKFKYRYRFTPPIAPTPEIKLAEDTDLTSNYQCLDDPYIVTLNMPSAVNGVTYQLYERVDQAKTYASQECEYDFYCMDQCQYECWNSCNGDSYCIESCEYGCEYECVTSCEYFYDPVYQFVKNGSYSSGKVTFELNSPQPTGSYDSRQYVVMLKYGSTYGLKYSPETGTIYNYPAAPQFGSLPIFGTLNTSDDLVIENEYFRITAPDCHNESTGSIEVLSLATSREKIRYRLANSNEDGDILSIVTSGADDNGEKTPPSGSDYVKFDNLAKGYYLMQVAGFYRTDGATNDWGDETHPTEAEVCYDDSPLIYIPEPAALSASAEIVLYPGGYGTTTPSQSDGRIKVTADGGLLDYSIKKNNTTDTKTLTTRQGYTDNFTSLSPSATYTFQVTDDAGCITTALSDEITPPPAITIKSNTTSIYADVNGTELASASYNGYAVQCYDSSIKGLELEAEGGAINGTLTYSVSTEGATDESTPAGEKAFLTNVSYPTDNGIDITITDINGYEHLINNAVSVTRPAALVASFVSVTTPSCYGASDAQIKVSVTGGVGGYQYQAPSGTWKNLTAVSGETDRYITGADFGDEGPQNLSIRCSNGCLTSVPYEVVNPYAIRPEVFDRGYQSCTQNKDGYVDLIIRHGTPPFLINNLSLTGSNDSYSVSTVPGYETNNRMFRISGLSANTYTLDFSDTRGCSVKDSAYFVFSIELDPDPVRFIKIDSVAPKCNIANGADTDGSFSVRGAGGTSPYQFRLGTSDTWQSPDTNGIWKVSGLKPGTYTISIRDHLSCPLTTTIKVPAAAEIVNTWAVSGESYDESSEVGSPSYVVCIGETVDISYNIAAGHYPISMSLDGTLEDGSPFTSQSRTINTTGTRTGSFTSLPAGVYTMTATDHYSCEENTESITIRTVETPTVMAQAVVKLTGDDGVAYHVSCHSGNDGTIRVTPTGEFGSNGGEYEVTLSGTNGYNQTNSVESGSTTSFENLRAMDMINGVYDTIDYSYTITNSINCNFSAYTHILQLNEPETIQVNPAILPAKVNGYELACFDDALDFTVEVTGGVHPVVGIISYGSYSQTATINYPNTTLQFRDVPEGIYSLTIRDRFQTTCQQIHANFVTIDAPPVLELTPDTAPPACQAGTDGVLQLVAEGGNPFPGGIYRYRITDYTLTGPFALSGLTCEAFDTTYQDSGDALYHLPAGFYDVEVEDWNGCITPLSGVEIKPASDPLLLAYESHTEPSCFGASDASLTVSASGGNPGAQGYKFTLTGGQLTAPVILYGSPSVTFENLESNIGYDYAVYDNFTVFVEDLTTCCEVPEYNFTDTLFIDTPSQMELTQDTDKTHRPTCYNGRDGLLVIGVTGGVPPYSYSLDGVTFHEVNFNKARISTNTRRDTLTLTNIPGDSTYTVYVRDAINNPQQSICTVSGAFTLFNGPRVVASISTSKVSCHGGNDGSATAFVSFTGNKDPDDDVNSNEDPGAFHYHWYNALGEVISTGLNATNLPAGDYTFSVTKTGIPCGTSVPVVINQPSKSVSITNILTSPESCSNKADGSAYVETEGGYATSSLEYALNGGVFKNLGNGLIENLEAGFYTIEVRNHQMCSSSGSFTIGISNITLEASLMSDVVCFGGSNGIVTLKATPGVPNRTLTTLEYSLDGWSYQASPTFTSLTAGEYTFYVREAGNTTCMGNTETIVIHQPSNENSPAICDPLQVFLVNTTPASCSSAANGTAEVDATGGTPPYAFHWPGEESHASNISTLLTSGAYQVIAEDANGLTDTLEFSIPSLDELFLIKSSVTDADCYGECTGAIALTLGGGSGNYRVEWDNGDTSSSIYHLCAGTYSYTAYDQTTTSCFISGSITINEPEAVSVEHVAYELATCYGGADGSLTVTAIGGSGSFDYLWENGQTNPTAINLTAGIHQLDISDSESAGCTGSFEIELPETPEITIADSLITPVSCHGGANGSITIRLANTTNPLIVWSNGKQGTTINGLKAGTYTATIQDASNCQASFSFVVPEPDPIHIELAKTNALCYGAANGTVTASVTGGSGTYTYKWTLGTTILQHGSSPQLSGVAEGIYQLSVSDGNGCKAVAGITIAEPAPLEITASEITTPSCTGSSDGQIAVVTAGGTAPYTYSWANEASGDSVIRNIPRGDYHLTITDANGCLLNTSFELAEPGPLQITAFTLHHPSCVGSEDGMIRITAEGGVGELNYNWSFGVTGREISGLPQGTYEVTVQDEQGCAYTTSYTLIDPNPLNLSNIRAIDPTCFEGSDGSISFNVSGGNAPFSYEWYQGETFTDDRNPLDSLGAGEYLASIRDSTGCILRRTFELFDPPQLFITTLKDSILLCEGSSTVLSAGAGWASYEWIRGLDFFADSREVEVSEAGNYHLYAWTQAGCVAEKAFSIKVDKNILSADFIYDTEVMAGDTVIMIDITNPLPDNVAWELPEGVYSLTDDSTSFYQELVFGNSGTYTLRMEGFLDNCTDVIVKEIIVAPFDPEASNGRSQAARKVAGDIAISIFPNPNTQGYATIEIDLGKLTDARMELVQLSTSTVLLSEKLAGKKIHALRLDTKHLRRGVYFIKVETNNQSKTAKMIIL